jgi:hypothetical protein
MKLQLAEVGGNWQLIENLRLGQGFLSKSHHFINFTEEVDGL